MNRIHLSGNLDHKIDDKTFWLRTYDGTFALCALPEAYERGMQTMESGDEVVVEGVLYMQPVHMSRRQVGQGQVNVTRIEAVRPSNRAKGVNRLWSRINRNRDSAELRTEQIQQQTSDLQIEASQHRRDALAAQQQANEAQEKARMAILDAMTGGGNGT